MTSDKAYAVEQRLNALLTAGTNDTWVNLGSMSNSWTRGTDGWAFCTHPSVDGRLVIVAWHKLTPGTTTDGTTIFNAANGFPTGYRPVSSFRRVPCYTDRIRDQGGGTYMTPAIEVGSDGSVTVYGIAAAATRLDCYGIFSIDES